MGRILGVRRNGDRSNGLQYPSKCLDVAFEEYGEELQTS